MNDEIRMSQRFTEHDDGRNSIRRPSSFANEAPTQRDSKESMFGPNSQGARKTNESQISGKEQHKVIILPNFIGHESSTLTGPYGCPSISRRTRPTGVTSSDIREGGGGERSLDDRGHSVSQREVEDTTDFYSLTAHKQSNQSSSFNSQQTIPSKHQRSLSSDSRPTYYVVHDSDGRAVLQLATTDYSLHRKLLSSPFVYENTRQTGSSSGRSSSKEKSKFVAFDDLRFVTDPSTMIENVESKHHHAMDYQEESHQHHLGYKTESSSKRRKKKRKGRKQDVRSDNQENAEDLVVPRRSSKRRHKGLKMSLGSSHGIEDSRVLFRSSASNVNVYRRNKDKVPEGSPASRQSLTYSYMTQDADAQGYVTASDDDAETMYVDANTTPGQDDPYQYYNYDDQSPWPEYNDAQYAAYSGQENEFPDWDQVYADNVAIPTYSGADMQANEVFYQQPPPSSTNITRKISEEAVQSKPNQAGNVSEKVISTSRSSLNKRESNFQTIPGSRAGQQRRMSAGLRERNASQKTSADETTMEPVTTPTSNEKETADMVTPAPDLTDPSAQAETTEVTQPTEPRTETETTAQETTPAEVPPAKPADTERKPSATAAEGVKKESIETFVTAPDGVSLDKTARATPDKSKKSSREKMETTAPAEPTSAEASEPAGPGAPPPGTPAPEAPAPEAPVPGTAATEDRAEKVEAAKERKSSKVASKRSSKSDVPVEAAVTPPPERRKSPKIPEQEESVTAPVSAGDATPSATQDEESEEPKKEKKKKKKKHKLEDRQSEEPVPGKQKTKSKKDKSEPATADTTVTQTDTVQDDTAQPTETPMAPPDTESTQKSVVLAEPTTNVAAQDICEQYTPSKSGRQAQMTGDATTGSSSKRGTQPSSATGYQAPGYYTPVSERRYQSGRFSGADPQYDYSHKHYGGTASPSLENMQSTDYCPPGRRYPQSRQTSGEPSYSLEYSTPPTPKYYSQSRISSRPPSSAYTYSGGSAGYPRQRGPPQTPMADYECMMGENAGFGRGGMQVEEPAGGYNPAMYPRPQSVGFTPGHTPVQDPCAIYDQPPPMAMNQPCDPSEILPNFDCLARDERYTDDECRYQDETSKTVTATEENKPLGTIVYQQVARYICVGTLRVAGGVRVIFDAAGKQAYVQIISPLCEVYITYYANNMTFLTSSSAAGVAWAGAVVEASKDEEPSKEAYMSQNGGYRNRQYEQDSIRSKQSGAPEASKSQIDTAQVVFCDPYQAQRFRTVVETLKSALSCNNGLVAPTVTPPPQATNSYYPCPAVTPSVIVEPCQNMCPPPFLPPCKASPQQFPAQPSMVLTPQAPPSAMICQPPSVTPCPPAPAMMPCPPAPATNVSFSQQNARGASSYPYQTQSGQASPGRNLFTNSFQNTYAQNPSMYSTQYQSQYSVANQRSFTPSGQYPYSTQNQGMYQQSQSQYAPPYTPYGSPSVNRPGVATPFYSNPGVPHTPASMGSYPQNSFQGQQMGGQSQMTQGFSSHTPCPPSCPPPMVPACPQQSQTRSHISFAPETSQTQQAGMYPGGRQSANSPYVGGTTGPDSFNQSAYTNNAQDMDAYDPYAYENNLGKTLFCAPACLVRVSGDMVWLDMQKGCLKIYQCPNGRGYCIVLENKNRAVSTYQYLTADTVFTPSYKTQYGFTYNTVTKNENRGSAIEHFLVSFMCARIADQFKAIVDNIKLILECGHDECALPAGDDPCFNGNNLNPSTSATNQWGPMCAY